MIWYLRSDGHFLPLCVVVSGDLRLFIAVPCTGHKVGFELRQREIFPLISLIQERVPLKGTEGCGLTVQGSYRAIPAHALQDGVPTRIHELIPLSFPFSFRLSVKIIFNFVSALGRQAEWFLNSCCLASRSTGSALSHRRSYDVRPIRIDDD